MKNEAQNKKARVQGLVVLILGFGLLTMFDEPVHQTSPEAQAKRFVVSGPKEKLRLYPDGSIARREFFVKGKPVGRHEFFSHGKITKVIHHFDGLDPVVLTFDGAQKPVNVENCPKTPLHDDFNGICGFNGPNEITRKFPDNSRSIITMHEGTVVRTQFFDSLGVLQTDTENNMDRTPASANSQNPL